MAVEGTYPFQRGAGAADDKTLRVVMATGGGGGGADVNLASIDGQTPDLGIGNAGPGTLRVALATDTPIALTADNINLNVSDIETLITAANALLTNIDSYVTFISDDQLAAIKTDVSNMASDTASLATDLSGFISTFGLPGATAETDSGQSATTMAFIKGLVSLSTNLNTVLGTKFDGIDQDWGGNTGTIMSHVKGIGDRVTSIDNNLGFFANASASDIVQAISEVETNTNAIDDIAQDIDDLQNFFVGSSLIDDVNNLRNVIGDTTDVTELDPSNPANIIAYIKGLLQRLNELELLEDDPHVSADAGIGALAVRTDTPANRSGTDGDYEFLQMSAGRLWVSAVVTDSVPGVAATSLGKAEDAVHSSGDTGVFALAVSNEAQSTFGTDGDYTPVAVDRKGNVMVGGNIAHDGVDAGNPIKVGYKAVAHGASPTAVAAGDRVDSLANRHGIPFTIGGHPNVVTLEAAYTAAQTDTAVIGSISPGTKIVVTGITVTCDNANSVDVNWRIGFGATNTPTTTGVVSSHPGCAAGSGLNRGNGAGILGIGGDGEELRITSSVPTGGSIRVNVSYYLIES